jgi:enterochelin esterase-like enzyme
MKTTIILLSAVVLAWSLLAGAGWSQIFADEPPSAAISQGSMIYPESEKFPAFLQRIYAAPEDQRQAIADSFLLAAGSLPFFEEDSIAYFLYRGSATKMTIAGDANSWDPAALAMARISGTTLFYARQVYERDARLDYKLVRNGTDWILDPRNPNYCYGGYGPNSELRMPGYMPASECVGAAGIATGTLVLQTFASAILKNSRSLRIYLPAGYDSARQEAYPLVLFHDGLEYLTLAAAKTVLDNLIAGGRIEPLIAVFVPPFSSTQRIEEYGGGLTGPFERFIIEELMPFLDAAFHTSKDPGRRAMMGPSLAALISAQICFHHPEAFGLCGLYSPAMWPNDRTVLSAVMAATKPFQKCYIDVGTYEPSLLDDAGRLRTHLIENEIATKYRAWHEGHSWGSWRAHIDEALEFFFPPDTRVEQIDAEKPEKLALFPSYPNPFNAVTTLVFDLPLAEEVLLTICNVRGEEVDRLVEQRLLPGRYAYKWNADGRPSGLYIFQLRAGAMVRTGKALLLK